MKRDRPQIAIARSHRPIHSAPSISIAVRSWPSNRLVGGDEAPRRGREGDLCRPLKPLGIRASRHSAGDSLVQRTGQHQIAPLTSGSVKENRPRPLWGAARSIPRTKRNHLAAPAYFAGSAFAFLAQSSQQTTISLPPTFTLIPSSLMSQSHTGHFLVFMRNSSTVE